MSRILLSINPEHVEKIFDGTKRYEFRKARCRRDVTEIVIYCTRPVKKIIGEASVDAVLEGSPEWMWERTSYAAGIDKIFFDSYFAGKEKAIAFEIGECMRYDEPLDLSDYGLSYAPQSYSYLDK